MNRYERDGGPSPYLAAGVIADVLDDVVQAIAAAGIPATRDPGEFQPPGAIVEPPTITGAATMAALSIDVPIFVVSDSPPSSSGTDALVDQVMTLLGVFGPSTATPTTWSSPINPAGLPAYLLTLSIGVSTT